MVSFGTPLSPTGTRLMLLGSGELGREVALEAKFPVLQLHDSLCLHGIGELQGLPILFLILFGSFGDEVQLQELVCPFAVPINVEI